MRTAGFGMTRAGGDLPSVPCAPTQTRDAVAISETTSTEDAAAIKKKKRQAGKLRNEQARLKMRLRGFDYHLSRSWIGLCNHFGSDLKQEELMSIAELVAKTANLRIDRDAKRRKIVLMKWFEENWSIVSSYMRFIVLEDATNE